MAAAHEQLKAALGQVRAAAMGVLSSGAAAYSQLLNETEEAAFEAGMREFGRTFHTIQAEMMPSRTVFDLQNYYFNVRAAHLGLHGCIDCMPAKACIRCCFAVCQSKSSNGALCCF